MARHASIVAVVAMLAGADAALACTPAPMPPKTPAMLSQESADAFRRARDLVEIRMIKTATDGNDGEAIVLRSVKKVLRPGTIVRVTTSAGAVCGFGDALEGTVQRMFVWGPAPIRFLPMEEQLQQRLRRLRLIPVDWPVAR
jgi:hypothetical protein